MKKKNLLVLRKWIDEIDVDLAAKIDDLVNNYGGTVFHETALNRMVSKAFGSAMSYFLAYEDENLVGCCPCHSFKEGLVTNSFSNLSSYEIPYGGWVFDPDRMDLENLVSMTKTGAMEKLVFVSNIALDPRVCRAWKTMGARAHETVMVKLTGFTQDQIFDGFKHSQKQKIRRALKLGLKTVSLTPDDFDEFTKLAWDLKRSAGLRSRDEGFYKEIFTHYYGKGRAVCTAVQYEGEYVSVGIALANKTYAIGWAAGRKIGIPNNLYQNELLIWDQIRWAKSIGCDYLDLGAIDPIKLPHLLRMKHSFSKETWNFFSFSLRPASYRLINKFQNNVWSRNRGSTANKQGTLKYYEK